MPPNPTASQKFPSTKRLMLVVLNGNVLCQIQPSPDRPVSPQPNKRRNVEVPWYMDKAQGQSYLMLDLRGILDLAYLPGFSRMRSFVGTPRLGVYYRVTYSVFAASAMLARLMHQRCRCARIWELRFPCAGNMLILCLMLALTLHGLLASTHQMIQADSGMPISSDWSNEVTNGF